MSSLLCLIREHNVNANVWTQGYQHPYSEMGGYDYSTYKCQSKSSEWYIVCF